MLVGSLAPGKCRRFFFMYQYDVETFMCACDRKGLAAKTMKSYEQTLRLFGQFLSVREIERTEEVKRVHIESYIDYLQKRGKYTVCAIDAPANSNNPENRSDYVKKISPTTINNYMRNMKVFFNWCMEQELIYKNPMEKVKYMKVKRKPLEFVSDADFKRLLGCMDISKFSEYRDSVIMQTLLDLLLSQSPTVLRVTFSSFASVFWDRLRSFRIAEKRSQKLV